MDACAVFTDAELDAAFGLPMAPGVPTLPAPPGSYGFCVVRPDAGPGSVSITLLDAPTGFHLSPTTPGERLITGVGQEASVGNGLISVIIRPGLSLSMVVYMPDSTVASDNFLIGLAQTGISHLP